MAAERGRRLDRAFGEVASRLEARDRAFAHELAYGTTRLRGRLDHLLSPHVRRGLDATEPRLRELLRLGAYQALYMDSVPPYAAVSETVGQARRVTGAKSSGFVNAVLRRVVERGDDPAGYPDTTTDPAGFLATWGSHPRWLVERWLNRWSFDEVRRLVERDNGAPDVSVVPLQASPGEAVARLAEAGIEAKVVGAGTRAVRLGAASSVTSALEMVGSAIVQDPGANLVSQYADVPSGMMVADFCAAPGGKVLALPAPRLRILAADRSESRIHVLKENALRVGRSVELVVADALHPPVREADVVMLDVPCTGTGTLARHPDARWRLDPEQIGAMAQLQAGMLEAAAEVVRPGGLLVYSTCTLEPEENAERVEAFLAGRSDFEIEDSGVVPETYRDDRGYLRVTPHAHGFDGAFGARLRKAS